MTEPLAVPLPGGGVALSGAVCAELAAVLAVHARTARRNGGAMSSALAEVSGVVSSIAADREARRHRESARAVPPAPSASGPSALDRPTSAPSVSEWITTAEAARRLGVTERQARRLARDGRVRARQDDRGTWRLDGRAVGTYGGQRGHEHDDGAGGASEPG